MTASADLAELLPPLPEPDLYTQETRKPRAGVFSWSAVEMRAYALAAIEAYRSAQAPEEVERAAFEHWVQQDHPGIDLHRRVDGSYWSDVPDPYWAGWQARAAWTPPPASEKGGE